MIARAAALLLGLAAPAAAQPAAGPQPESPQAWWVYAGGYTARSAMDALSVVRTGNIARFTQAVVSTATQWKTGDMPFDYMVATIEYDCAARSARAVRIEYRDRTCKRLKVSDTPAAAFISGAGSSEFAHFMPVACRDLASGAPPGLHDTLAGFLAGNAFWNQPARK